MSRVIVTVPLIRATRRVVVDAAGGGADAPARILRESFELDDGSCAAAFGARAAGADVTFFALCEAALEKPLRARLEAQGVRCRIRVVAAASAGVTCFDSTDGVARFAVSDARLPDIADVDRLQDEIADDLLRAPAFVVVAGDLDGARKPDYAERVVGRAWGLGMKSLISASLPALKQAYHTYPYGIVLRSEDVRAICAMPRSPADETEAQTIQRSFSESMRVFAVRSANDTVALVTAEDRIEVTTTATDAWIAGALGACAAADLAHPGAVVRRAADLLKRGAGSGNAPAPLEGAVRPGTA